MRFTRKRIRVLSGLSCILAVASFFFAAVNWGISAQLFIESNLTDYGHNLLGLSTVVGLITTFGFLTFSWIALHLTKTKIAKETYYFALLVPLFSFLGYIISNTILEVGLSVDVLIVASVVIATPASCLLAGYSRRALLGKLRSLGFDQGITVIATVVLLSIPSISPVIIQSTGRIVIPYVILRDGSDTERVGGEVTGWSFSAEIPVPSNIAFNATQIVNFTNIKGEEIRFKTCMREFYGNLSKVRYLSIFFTFPDGSEMKHLVANNGTLEYEENSISMEKNATVAVGVTCSAHPTEQNLVMSLLLTIQQEDELCSNILFMSD